MTDDEPKVVWTADIDMKAIGSIKDGIHMKIDELEQVKEDVREVVEERIPLRVYNTFVEEVEKEIERLKEFRENLKNQNGGYAHE